MTYEEYDRLSTLSSEYEMEYSSEEEVITFDPIYEEYYA